MQIPKELAWIKDKIKECEKAMERTEINIATASEYKSILKTHTELHNLLYFKIHQEENYLLK